MSEQFIRRLGGYLGRELYDGFPIESAIFITKK